MNSKCISITYYVNPHMFWYKLKYDEDHESFQDIIDIEKNIANYCINIKSSLIENLIVGDIIAVKYIPWNKYIRTRILQNGVGPAFVKETILWSIDHGFPFLTLETYAYKLPRILKIPIYNKPRFGSVMGIAPIKKIFINKSNMDFRIIEVDYWEDPFTAIKMKDFIENAISIIFEECYCTANEQYYGNLFLIDRGDKICDIKNWLEEKNVAVIKKCFKKRLTTFLSNNTVVLDIGKIFKNTFSTNVKHFQIFGNKTNLVKNVSLKSITENSEHCVWNNEDRNSNVEHIILEPSSRPVNQNTTEICLYLSTLNDSSTCLGKFDNKHEALIDAITTYLQKSNGSLNQVSYQNETQTVQNIYFTTPLTNNIECNKFQEITEIIKSKNVFSKSYLKLETKPQPIVSEREICFSDLQPQSGSCENESNNSFSNYIISKRLQRKHKNKDANLMPKAPPQNTENETDDNLYKCKWRKLTEPKYQMAKLDKITTTAILQKQNGDSEIIIDLEKTVQCEVIIKTNPNLNKLSDNKLNDSMKCSPTQTVLEELGLLTNSKNFECETTMNEVLTYSTSSIRPINLQAKSYFVEKIHTLMNNLGIKELFPSQAYSWPHIIRENSLFIVNSKSTGKTWSYLPIICNILSTRYSKTKLKKSFGPIAIILVSSSIEVIEISNLCKIFIKHEKAYIKIVESYGKRNAIKVKIDLLNSCGILVTTPGSLVRLLKDNETQSLIDPNRLLYLIVDDHYEITLRNKENYLNILDYIFETCFSPENHLVPLMFIVVSSKWDSLIPTIINKSINPLLVLGDYLEAAFYAHVEVKVDMQKSDLKINSILNFIKYHPLNKERLIITCNCDDDVEFVVDSLMKAGKKCVRYSNRSSVEELSIVNNWKVLLLSQLIVVCSDDIFSNLKVQNFQNLIHFSMPSWSQFKNRFSVLAQKYSNHVVQKFSYGNKCNEKICVMILLDEQKINYLHRIIHFFKRHDYLESVHNDITKLSEKILDSIEQERVQLDCLLCPLLLKFGECNRNYCTHRHRLKASDIVTKNSNIPSSGYLKINILEVKSPSHYTAHLLEYRSLDSSKWYSIENGVRLLCKMNTFYTTRESPHPHWPLALNDLCVYINEKECHRVRILKVYSSNNAHNENIKNVIVDIKLIDIGIILQNISSNHLFHLKAEFKNYPPIVIDIHLLGIVPFDNEENWNKEECKMVQDWMQNFDLNYNFYIKIEYSLTSTIWVNNIIVWEDLPKINSHRYAFSINDLISQNQLGEFLHQDSSTFPIRKMIQEFKLSYPEEYTEEIEEAQKPIEKMERGNIEEDIISLRYFENDTDSKELCFSNIDLKASSTSIVDFSDENKADDFKEEWASIPLNKLVKLEVGDNEALSNIYLQRADQQHMEQFVRLNALIEHYVTHLREHLIAPLTKDWFQPLRNCIVYYYNMFLRAKVYEIFEDNTKSLVYKFFLCDYAGFAIIPAKDLNNGYVLRTTKEIVEFTPFQSVHCTLGGIKLYPISKYLKIKSTYLYAIGVKLNEKNHENNLGIPSLEVLLFNSDAADINENKMFNILLVEDDVAYLDQNTSHILEVELYRSTDYVEKSNSSLTNKLDHLKYSEISFNDFLKSVKKSAMFKYEEKLPNTNTTAKCDDRNQQLESQTRQMKNVRLPLLTILNKRPQVTWYQTNQMIYLGINALEIVEYYLEVSSNTLIFMANLNEKKEVLILHFFGAIQPKLVSHEIQGVMVIIRLVKSIFLTWSQLLIDQTKYPWLQYDMNAINTGKTEIVTY